MLDEVVERVESTVKALAQQGGEFLRESELDVRLEALKRKTEQVVKEHPVETLVAGAILGYFIGRIFFRGR